METREITEIKLWQLILNPMQSNAENGDRVAVSYEKQKLIDWYNSMLAHEPYDEEESGSFECHGGTHKWRKVFLKGTLEWYNPCDNFNFVNHYGHGISYIWVQEAINIDQLNMID